MTASRAPLLAVLLALLAVAPADAVVGGKVTTADWPHMTAVEFRSEEGFDFGCAGSLVRPDVVLTAAHCVSRDEDGPDTLPASSVRVQIPPRRPDGTRRRSDGGRRIAVSEIVEHPDFDGSREGGSDVALLRLTAAAAGRPIRLADGGDAAQTAPGTEATVIGWGAQFPFGPATDELREASVPLVGDDDCEQTSTSRLDRPTQLCAGNLEGAEDSCQGDSGGPLMVRDGSGAWILVGVVSQGVGCGTPTQYGIYAEAMGDPLRSFIESTASRLSSAGSGTSAPGSGSGSGGSGDAGDGQAAPEAAAQPAPASTRLTLPRRVRAGARRVTVRLRTSGEIRRIRVRLIQRGRTVAAGRRARLRSRAGRVRLGVRRRVRRGRAVLRVTARDAGGRRVRASRRVRLRV